MFSKLRNSWALFKASVAVLRADKELILLPIVSTIGVLVVTATFALPMFFAGLFDALIGGESRILGLIVAFFFYVAQYFVIFFANSALVGAAMIRLRGGDPTLRDGFRIAFQRFGGILGYALISATVGMILRALSERGKLGKLLSALGGLVWNLATYLVVPVLVVEDVGPFEAIKRSVNYLKRTWGEQIAGNYGLGALMGLVVFLVILIAIPVFFFAIKSAEIAIIVAAVVLFVLAFVLIGLINSTLKGIYVAAVYRFAAEGETGSFFPKEMIEGAFRPK